MNRPYHVCTVEMENIEQQKIISMNKVFDSRFLDSNTLYLYHFNEVPSLHFRNKIDGERAFNAIKRKIQPADCKYTCSTDGLIIIRKSFSLIQLSSSWIIIVFWNLTENYCQVLHNNQQSGFLERGRSIWLVSLRKNKSDNRGK